MQLTHTHVKSTTGKTKPPAQSYNTGTKVHNEILPFLSGLLHFSLIIELFTEQKATISGRQSEQEWELQP